MFHWLSRKVCIALLLTLSLGCAGPPTGEAMRYSGGEMVPLSLAWWLAEGAGRALTTRKEEKVVNPALAEPAVLYRAKPLTPGQPMPY